MAALRWTGVVLLALVLSLVMVVVASFASSRIQTDSEQAAVQPFYVPPDPLPLEYGQAFGMIFRFRTQVGEAPVLRLLWRKGDSTWRVTS
mgnify:CR=1 FL=1